jgi:hypothetical protein
MKNKENEPESISPELERYIAICKRMWDKMEETGRWPWDDDLFKDK